MKTSGFGEKKRVDGLFQPVVALFVKALGNMFQCLFLNVFSNFQSALCFIYLSVKRMSLFPW